MGLKARVLCKAVVCGLGTGAIASQSCPSRLPEGPSIIRTDAPHCMLTSWVFWSISADVTRGARGPLRMHSRVLEAYDEAVALGWTAYEMADRRAPGAENKYRAQDKTYGLAEISSTFAPTTWQRSVRRVRLQLVGDRPAVSIGIFHASVYGDALKNFAHCLSDSLPVLKHL